MNGAEESIFKNSNSKEWNKKEPLKIVTHHWSPNKMKGFDVYKELDQLIITDEWRDKIKFTYIGNLPNDFKFKNTKVIKPISGKDLGFELSRHHVYITASNNEPAGMHHIEGALSGLPILYIESGGITEYCKNYGVCFNNSEFVPALRDIMSNYSLYYSNLKYYPNNARKMTENYLNLFSSLIRNKEEIVSKRKIFSLHIFIKEFYFFDYIFFEIFEINNQK